MAVRRHRKMQRPKDVITTRQIACRVYVLTNGAQREGVIASGKLEKGGRD